MENISFSDQYLQKSSIRHSYFGSRQLLCQNVMNNFGRYLMGIGEVWMKKYIPGNDVSQSYKVKVL